MEVSDGQVWLSGTLPTFAARKVEKKETSLVRGAVRSVVVNVTGTVPQSSNSRPRRKFL